MTLYIPPTQHLENRPLIFLAGPIQGADRWQNKAANFFTENGVDVASPRYIGENENTIGDWAPHITSEEQIDWESYHLDKAGEKGVILFWLANEEKHHCERAFAQTTRFELGEWKERHNFYDSKLVVGMEEGFSGRGYIKYRLKKYPNIPIEYSLIDACKKSLEIL